MKKYNYKDLEAYKEAKILVRMIYSLLQRFPKEEMYALCDQLRRAVISVPSNIAEGSGRTSAKDQAHFFEMAFGSLMEVDCQVDIAHDLGYIAQHDMDIINEQINRVAALLSGMRRKILGDNSLTRKFFNSLNIITMNNSPECAGRFSEIIR